MTGEQNTPEPEQNNGLLLTHLIAQWSEVLDGEEDTATRLSLAKEAMTELDELWEQEDMFHEECLVSGFGFWIERQKAEELTGAEKSEYDEFIEDDYRYVLMSGEVTGLEAVSQGFTYSNMHPGGKPQLWHQFEIEPYVEQTHPAMYTTHRRWIFIDPPTANIVAGWKFDEPFEPDISSQELHIDERLNRLDKHSLELAKLVGSTAFRRTSRKRQLHLLDERIEAAEQEVASRGADVVISPQFAYLSEIAPNHPGLIGYRKITFSNTILSGVCLGLTMTGIERVHNKAIRRDSDLINKHNGLSMSIELSDELDFGEAKGLLKSGSVLHIPLSSQPLEIALQPQTYTYEMLNEKED